MKRIKFLGIMMLGMSCLFQSCKSELDELQQESIKPKDFQVLENERKQKYAVNAVDESIKGDFELRNGVLHFKNFETFKKVRDSFINLHMPERAAFAEKQGFESRISVTYDVLEQLRETKSKEDYDNLIKSYSDIIAFDEISQSVISRISDDCIASILNKDGLVFIGKILYKFTDGLEFIVFDGDKSRLSNIKNARVGESLEMSIINTKTVQSNKNARICTYMGGYEIATNSTNRWGKIEYKVDAPVYYYEPNNNYYNPWRAEAHSYAKGDALMPGTWGGRFSYWTWHWLFVSYKLQLAIQNNVLGSTIVQGERLEASMGADFHSYVSAYRPNNQESISVLINDNNSFNPPFVQGQNKYNWAEAGPNQWIYPNDCHSYYLQW
jgi:hypothetical protein